ncbi:calcium/sodium antiporter [Lentisphaerota bacterium WC36G]|nr:calcium/sodium antiporter [Lentisphaerae bacterium WC36]
MQVLSLASIFSEGVANSMWFNAIIFLVGLIILIKGADWFVDSASFVAKKAHVPDIVIGLTLVSLGTSLPEFATNVYAVIENNSEIAVGNAVGSNITNIALVLGAGVFLMRSVDVSKKLFFRDCLFMFFVTVLVSVMPWFFPEQGDTNRFFINRGCGVILIILTICYITFLVKNKDDHEEIGEAAHDTEEHPEHHKAFKSIAHAIVFFIIGLIMTIYGAKMLVDSVVTVSRQFKLNEEIISATIVAFGTSVPELAVTVSGAMKGKNDIALGNVLGSNIFNIILVLGFNSLIKPLVITSSMATEVMPFMLILSALLIFFIPLKWKLKRWHGVIFLAAYIGYISYNVMIIK